MTKDLKILVLGIGNGGNSAIEGMANSYDNIEFWALNTDKQILKQYNIPNKLLLGENLAMGLGSGGDVALGRKCALESKEEIEKILFGADMVYLVSCLSGGTGTGAVSIIAEIAKRMGILTVSVVTIPFAFEGRHALEKATLGLKVLKKYTDAYIKIKNNDILKVIPQNCSMGNGFKIINEIVHNAITSINDILFTENIGTPSTNIDFADIRRIFNKAGEISITVAEAEGENKTDKVIEILKNALSELSPIQAKRLILNVTGDENITLHNVYEIAQALKDKISDSAEILFGCVINEELKDKIKVTLLWSPN